MGTAEFVLTRDRPVAELVNDRKRELTSHFARLLYLARCRDADGIYRHSGLELTHDPGDVHRALLAAHEECFAQWLGLSAMDRRRDLLSYMDGLDRRRVVEAWLPAYPWSAMVSPSAHEVKCAQFACSLRTLLQELQS
jgi:hypothetical protein